MKRYSIEEIYPKSQMGKCMIYFNMSHHYRRIYSAKPRVDTNLSKKSQPQFCCSSPDVYNFIRRNCMRKPITFTPRHKVCIKEEEEHASFKPKILEHRAQSKLRTLPIYQPPQKIVYTKDRMNESTKVTKNKEDKKNTEENNNEFNQNPEHPLPETEEHSSPEQVDNKEKIDTDVKMSEAALNNEEDSRYRPLDKSTVMFLKDITDDILRKGIYTNKSLEKLFSHHIQKNKYSLPQDLMEKEVARLKLELEMPLEDEKTITNSTVEDEEVLTALDSLLLPADIRDQVASSLGLKRKPPPLPSPKDSFTGSLALTSMSDGQEKNAKNDLTGTYTLKTDEFNGIQERKDKSDSQIHKSLVPESHQEYKASVSDNDETIADEEYPEEVNSEPTNNDQEVASEQSNRSTDVKSDGETNDKESDNEEESNITEIKSEAKSESDDSNESTSNVSEVKSSPKDKESGQEDEGDNKEDNSSTSESESIHTEEE